MNKSIQEMKKEREKLSKQFAAEDDPEQLIILEEAIIELDLDIERERNNT